MAVVVSLAAVPLAAACGGSSKGGLGDSRLPSGVGGKPLDHEDCSESGNRVEVLDTNGDGKPDIRRVFDKGSGREICRIADLNHDGKADMYEYNDSNGAVRRREYCYDDTGMVNAIEYYDGGKLVRREYDTGGLHKIDTWDWFDGSAPIDSKTGRPAHPARRERDVTGDGKVDQWWTWSGDNVTIAIDSNGDGKPDPASTIVLGKDGQPVTADSDNGGAPPGSPAPSASSSSSTSSSPSLPPSSSSSAPSPSSAAAASAAPSSVPLTPVASSSATAPTDGGKL